MFILRIGAIVGAAYISGILGTGGGFMGDEKGEEVGVEKEDVFIVGMDFFALQQG